MMRASSRSRIAGDLVLPVTTSRGRIGRERDGAGAASGGMAHTLLALAVLLTVFSICLLTFAFFVMRPGAPGAAGDAIVLPSSEHDKMLLRRARNEDAGAQSSPCAPLPVFFIV